MARVTCSFRHVLVIPSRLNRLTAFSLNSALYLIVTKSSELFLNLFDKESAVKVCKPLHILHEEELWTQYFDNANILINQEVPWILITVAGLNEYYHISVI